MAYGRHVGGGLDHAPCRYGASKLVFRGPQADLAKNYVAFLGSTETFGKFVRVPFPALAGQRLGLEGLNLGSVNAGIDSFLGDPMLRALVTGAQASVVQVMGAHKLTNRYYLVHPRRNDRFLAATPLLTRLYPEADFADVHFTRHLLSILRAIDETRFAVIVEELQAVWVERMRALVQSLPVPPILLWVSRRTPEDGGRALHREEPLFVTTSMLEAIRHLMAGLVTVTLPPAGPRPPRGMICSALEAPAAVELPGPASHRTIADALLPALRDRLRKKQNARRAAGVRGRQDLPIRASRSALATP